MLSVQRKIPMVDHVYSLLYMVWKTYHYSSKSMRELQALEEELGVHVSVPGSVSGTHWLAHPGQFTAVYFHMEHLTASSTNTDIAGRARKVCIYFQNDFIYVIDIYKLLILITYVLQVKRMMKDGAFVGFLHFLADLFEAISKFSLLLQRNYVILPQVMLRC